MSKTNTPSFTLNAFTDIFSPSSVVTSPAGVPWYETLNCKDSVDMIFEYEEKAQESFIGMGYFLKRIKEKELFKELGYDNMWTFAKEQCHMDESAVSRFINLCERFSKDNNSPILDTRFKGYSKSQLIEMISIKDDQTMEKVNPDMTVKQIREVKKEASNEPTDRAIRDFFNYCLSDITQEEFADLKNYLIKEYGKSHTGGTIGLSHFICSTRGIRINNFDEITWAKFVSRIYLLEDLVPDCIKNPVKDEKEDELPGQMHIGSDFPQYCPDSSNQERDTASVINDNENCDVANEQEDIKFPEKKEVIIDGDFREVSANPVEEVQKIRSPKKSSHLEDAVIDKREDSMTKYKCNTCLQEFILGDYATKIMASNEPKCPYCGQKNIEWTAKADPGEIEDIGRMSLWAMIF